jgi:hypothetical protein
MYNNTHLHTQCWVGGLAIFLIFGRQLLPIQALCLLCLNTSSSYSDTQHLHSRCWVGGLAIFLILSRHLLPIQALCLFCLNTSSYYTHTYITTHNRCWVGCLAIFLIFGRQLLPIQALCLLCLNTSFSYTDLTTSTQPVLGRWSSYLFYLWQATPSYSGPVFILLEDLLLLHTHNSTQHLIHPLST